jgi:spermidine synthase
MAPLLASALVFFTNAAVLVLEILAGRLLAPYVGVTLQTFTGIIGVVLAGIALGTWYGGRLADRVDPNKLLGPMLVIGGALSIASLPLIRIFGSAGLGAGPPAIILLSLVGFFLPAAVLSAVSPAVIKLQLESLDETGSVVGWLSALGTIGALFGSFITGFLLVAALPTGPIINAVGGALIVAGIALWVVLARRDSRGRSLIATSLVLALATGLLGAVIPGRCEIETAYFCASVREDPDRPSGRVLVLDTLRHSYVDLDDPTYIEFTYIQGFADVLEAVAPDEADLDVLHLGGGGFSLPRYLAATRPGTTSVVFEIDAQLVEIAEDELDLQVGPDLQVRTGDARINVQDEPDDAYDFVFGDAFGGQAVPYHLATVELMAQVDRVLTDDGAYAINVIDYGPLRFARAQLATLRSVFAHVAVIAPPDQLEGRAGGNFVMVGSQAPLPVDDLAAAIARRGDELVVMSDPQDVVDFVDDAQVLRDEFAPVDQLLTPIG